MNKQEPCLITWTENLDGSHAALVENIPIAVLPAGGITGWYAFAGGWKRVVPIGDIEQAKGEAATLGMMIVGYLRFMTQIEKHNGKRVIVEEL